MLRAINKDVNKLKENVYAHLQHRTEKFKTIAIFNYLNNSDIDAVAKMRVLLTFMFPMLLGFSDTQKFFLHQAESESFYDSIQKKIISHAVEEKNHFMFLWNDLEILGMDHNLSLGQALKFYMSEDLEPSRLVLFKIISMYSTLGSLEKEMLLESLEEMSFYFFSVTKDIKIPNKDLQYFGEKHFYAEENHEHIGGGDGCQLLDNINLTNHDANKLMSIIDQTFDVLIEWFDHMHDFCCKYHDIPFTQLLEQLIPT